MSVFADPSLACLHPYINDSQSERGLYLVSKYRESEMPSNQFS